MIFAVLIVFRSLRRCVKASPAIASAPPIHVLGSGTGACDHREHDVVAIASGVTDRENGTVAARHGAPLGDPRKCADDGARGDFVQNGKCLPERQCRADCDHKIATGNDNCSCVHLDSVISAASGGAVDINSKIGGRRQCECACAEELRCYYRRCQAQCLLLQRL